MVPDFSALALLLAQPGCIESPPCLSSSCFAGQLSSSALEKRVHGAMHFQHLAASSNHVHSMPAEPQPPCLQKGSADSSSSTDRPQESCMSSWYLQSRGIESLPMLAEEDDGTSEVSVISTQLEMISVEASKVGPWRRDLRANRAQERSRRNMRMIRPQVCDAF